jgi:amidase
VTGNSRPASDVPALLTGGIESLQAEMAAGRTTARELVRQYSQRVHTLDDGGPRLGHVLELNPDATTIAAGLDEERRRGAVRGPLHGIPILLKDNLATADAMETAAGSLALIGVRPPRDAFVVARLRAAGAVILGKTNLSEWANFRGNPSVSGWSGRGGQTRNPHALDRSPGGSSSGSAVAAAAMTCAGAIGTETSGSIIAPASMCGIVGVKPTVGLVSRAGIIPIAPSLDTAGPMTRTVRDAAILLTVLAGTDPADLATAEADTRREDYLGGLDASALRGARLGVLRPSPLPVTEPLFEAALRVLRAEGCTLVKPVSLTEPATADRTTVMESEFRDAIERYLRDWAPTAPMRTIEDLIAFNRREARVELAFFGQQRLESAARRPPLTDPGYLEARERLLRSARAEGIDAVMDGAGLDAIVAPSAGPARLIDLVNGDAGGASVAGLPAAAGYPHVTVPMGLVAGLPVGLSFFGRAWSDGLLLRLAFGFEQATHHLRTPRFAATADVPWSGRPG